MNIRIVILLLVAIVSVEQLFAQNNKIILDDITDGAEQINTGQIICFGKEIQYAKGLAWTPANYAPVVSVNTKNTVKLKPGCYTSMKCGIINGEQSVIINRSLACGGNALPDDFVVINLHTLKPIVIDYIRGKNIGFD